MSSAAIIIASKEIVALLTAKTFKKTVIKATICASQMNPNQPESQTTNMPIAEPLRFATPLEWQTTVLDNFDDFLLDHAAAEKKAAGMALSMISHYPDRLELVEAMADLAVEEMSHYREVIRWIHRRGLQLAADTKDPYILAIRGEIRKGRDAYFLDRLITSGIIEARGCERFSLVEQGLPEGALKRFYNAIVRSEQRHYEELINLANLYFDKAEVAERADELLDIEAKIVEALPIRPALH